MELEAIKAVARAQMRHKRSHAWKERGNKYDHGQRVATLAATLRGLVFPDDASHDDILTVAAWFHDIANGEDDHCAKGAQITRGLLEEYCLPSELDEICAIIAVHDDRKPEHSVFTPWIKLHQDADHLDHFGTFDIWTHFLYVVPHDETISGTREYLLNDRMLLIDQYRRELNFEFSRSIYDDKADFLRSFGERFAVESQGGIWNLEEIFFRFRQQHP